jgi:hypothetical protein
MHNTNKKFKIELLGMARSVFFYGVPRGGDEQFDFSAM